MEQKSPQSKRTLLTAIILFLCLCAVIVAAALAVWDEVSPLARRGMPSPPVTIVTATPVQPSPTATEPKPGKPTEVARPTTPPPTPYPTEFNLNLRVSRHIGYGISVAPHLRSRPGKLREMGFDWVKVYQTDQLGDYPEQQVLFRVDVDPNDLDGWERGLQNLAPELAQRGAVAVEIGNEPNLASEWRGNSNPAEFTDALCRAYRIFKQTAPQLTVVAGGLAPADNVPGRALNDLEFAQAMFDAGAGNCFDAWGYHPYGFDQPPEADPSQHEMSFRRAERMYSVLAANGLGNRQIWITEFGWLRDPRETGVDCTKEPAWQDFAWMTVPMVDQAIYTAQAIAYAANNWPWAGPMFLWNLNWNLYDTSYEPLCSHLRWYAVLDSKNVPLPVYYTVTRLEKGP